MNKKPQTPPELFVDDPSEADRPQVDRLMWQSFEVSGEMVDVTKWGWNERPGVWSYVVRDGEAVVAAFSFETRFDNRIRGVRLPLAGVWGVATAVTHRRRGLLRKLFGRGFQQMKTQGVALSVLNPASVALYEKFGYADAEQYAIHTFDPRRLRPWQLPAGVSVREITAPQERAKAVAVQKTMARFGSRMFELERHFEKGFTYLFERGGEPVGMLHLLMTGPVGDYQIEVRRCAYTSDDVLPALAALVGRFAEESVEVKWTCDTQIPVQQFVVDRWHINTRKTGTMMVRVIDFEAYCSQVEIAAHAAGPLVIDLQDAHCPWNSAVYRLAARDGKLQVERLEGGTPPDVTLNALQLSHLVGGLTPVSQLRALGLLPCSEAAAETLAALFPPDNFFSYPRF
jgi:predicted acetyltransferase